MGCGSSKTAILAFGSPTNRPSSAPSNKSQISVNSRKGKPSSASSRKNHVEHGNSAAVPFRGSSANSKSSIDSGIGADSRDGSVTNGRPTLLPAGPRQSQRLPAELNTLKPDRPRPRIDEGTILASLRQEGLLGAPNTSTTKGGLCFEVSAEELKVRSKRPPARLQRLETNQKNGSDQERIRQKLSSAEARRKKREQEKAQRNREKDAKNLQIKLASLDVDTETAENSEVQKSSQGRIISAKYKRRPPSADSQVPPTLLHDSLELIASKASPLIIDELKEGAKKNFF